MTDRIRVGILLGGASEEREISLLAISVSHIEEQPVVQLDLPLGMADETHRPGARRGMARLLADRYANPAWHTDPAAP